MGGTPIIAPTTGGLTRQVLDHRDGSHNGVAMPVEYKTLVGSQGVPYIYEDYVSVETISESMMKLYNLEESERTKLRSKVKEYAKTQFNISDTVDDWHTTMSECIEKFKSGYQAWECEEL